MDTKATSADWPDPSIIWQHYQICRQIAAATLHFSPNSGEVLTSRILNLWDTKLASFDAPQKASTYIPSDPTSDLPKRTLPSLGDHSGKGWRAHSAKATSGIYQVCDKLGNGTLLSQSNSLANCSERMPSLT